MLSSKGKDQLKSDEGLRLKSYKDSLGVLSIGYGFNLTRHDADDTLLMAGVSASDIAGVKAGSVPLTEDQANALFDVSLSSASNDARKLVNDFNSHPQAVKDTLVNLSYQLGHKKLSGFEDMLGAINDRDYVKAGAEVLDSKLAKQTPKRAKRNAERIKAEAKELPKRTSIGKKLTEKERYKQEIFNNRADLLAKSMSRETIVNSLADNIRKTMQVEAPTLEAPQKEEQQFANSQVEPSDIEDVFKQGDLAKSRQADIDNAQG